MKTLISFRSEVYSKMSDLKHDVNAERWAGRIKERVDSGMTIKEWCRERNTRVAALLLAGNTPPGRNKCCGLTTAGFPFRGTAGHLSVERTRAEKNRSHYTRM